MDASPAATPIEIAVNGKPTPSTAGTLVSEFLSTKSLHPRLVVVELNGTILSRDAFGTTSLTDGDRVEIVHFVGGGSGDPPCPVLMERDQTALTTPSATG